MIAKKKMPIKKKDMPMKEMMINPMGMMGASKTAKKKTTKKK